MTADHTWEPAIGEAELARLTRDMDQAHRATLPLMHAAGADLAEELRTRRTENGDIDDGAGLDASRRRFLLGAGAGGGAAALVLAACSSSNSSPAPTSPASRMPGSPAASGQYTGGLRVVALAATLENQAALDAAKDGKLGTVPPAIATFVTTAMAQHADHAKDWNAVLTGAGLPAITNVPLSNQADTMAALGKAASVGDVVKLALDLEDRAAQTYLFATYNVTSSAGIATAARIAPVEAMHPAILN
ncbi:ferritin-like domain-containing protein [Kitasatospora sp. NPDC098652]|uniref:ferritin-like domain-containing protein n=1 Tax=Kitasatospora sp. NPDC098652 TaxID=3364095 RepID=UPI0037FD2758